MAKRFVSIWFRQLKTDWFVIRQPEIKEHPFVVAAPDHGRMIINAVNAEASANGIETGMAVADARAMVPDLKVMDDKPGLSGRLLKGIAEWCIRYSPEVAIDLPDGIMIDATGCAHLWGGEKLFLKEITNRLKSLGYTVRAAMADTIGAAWAIARYGQITPVIEPGQQSAALLSLPPAALRLETLIIERLDKLGLHQVKNIIGMPRFALRRRFGESLLLQIDKALGLAEEIIIPVNPIEPFQERLPCLEPIVTATGIEIALKQLLEKLNHRLNKEQKGLRHAIFKCYRVDGKVIQIEIGTHRPSVSTRHLFKLFEIKLQTIEPALGIELFILEAPKVEELIPIQERLWEGSCGLEANGLAELIDRLANKIGSKNIHRYLPDQHHWPERSIRQASSITEKPDIPWRIHRPRPLQLLNKPEAIGVAAPIPDYPPMLFRYKGKVHNIKKADGPERIETEWWLEEGQHRDYYSVEDEEGHRYWIFRSGHYSAENNYQWFLHGIFA
ncbi:Y-family DNA polymerase [Flavitalea sp.]|nr:DNA polymerase Y family protein [Flavitalea sp.]